MWPLADARAGLDGVVRPKGVTNVDSGILIILAILVLAGLVVWFFSRIEAKSP